LAELQAAGCARVYSEKASGARGDRTELRKVIDRLEPGDVLVVTRLDRLARSTRDLLNVLESVKQAGAGFRRGHYELSGRLVYFPARHICTPIVGQTGYRIYRISIAAKSTAFDKRYAFRPDSVQPQLLVRFASRADNFALDKAA
jgi:hypothetical protein